ncbi:hypothetical protein NE237_007250 [Protea cynaroides]|uniref:Uncharacterized protein n=1 Tax=Protea cynaroides TaxID=273540 RepID=A0A9Q0KPV3_9MAGN|nr:hypothetical protein NE237_007250 [Protea cynaroides]
MGITVVFFFSLISLSYWRLRIEDDVWLWPTYSSITRPHLLGHCLEDLNCLLPAKAKNMEHQRRWVFDENLDPKLERERERCSCDLWFITWHRIIKLMTCW